jgi:hypothetical protein
MHVLWEGMLSCTVVCLPSCGCGLSVGICTVFLLNTSAVLAVHLCLAPAMQPACFGAVLRTFSGGYSFLVGNHKGGWQCLAAVAVRIAFDGAIV